MTDRVAPVSSERGSRLDPDLPIARTASAGAGPPVVPMGFAASPVLEVELTEPSRFLPRAPREAAQPAGAVEAELSR